MTFLAVDQLGFGDTAALDAFQRLRVSSAVSFFDSQQEYGLNTLRVWDAVANGTGAALSSNGSVSNSGAAVGPTNTVTGLTPVSVTTGATSYAVLQSRQYIRYIPGKSQFVAITGIFAPGGGEARLVLRRSVTGAVVDTAVSQASWSEDRFDGSGPSGVVLDLTKVQILVIDAQMLYAGRIRVGFDVGGRIHWAHHFLIANIQSLPTVRTFNLPVRVESRNIGASEYRGRAGLFDSDNGVFLEVRRAVQGGSVQFLCCTVQSESGIEAKGFAYGVGNATTTIAVTSRRPVLSIRPKATFNGRTNRAHIELAGVDILATTNSAYWEMVLGGTLTGASFASVGPHSVTERDVAASAISGGEVLAAGFVGAAGPGAGAVGNLASTVDTRLPLTLSQIDTVLLQQPSLTLVCTSMSGTSNVAATFNFFEQVV